MNICAIAHRLLTTTTIIHTVDNEHIGFFTSFSEELSAKNGVTERWDFLFEQTARVTKDFQHGVIIETFKHIASIYTNQCNDMSNTGLPRGFNSAQRLNVLREAIDTLAKLKERTEITMCVHRNVNNPRIGFMLLGIENNTDIPGLLKGKRYSKTFAIRILLD